MSITKEITEAEALEVIDGLTLGKSMGLVAINRRHADRILHELWEFAEARGVSSLSMSWSLGTLRSEQGGKLSVLSSVRGNYRGYSFDRVYVVRDLDAVVYERVARDLAMCLITRGGNLAPIGESREQHAERVAKWNQENGR